MPILDPPPNLHAAKDEYEKARQEIVDYIQTTSTARAQVAAEGHIRQVFSILSAEMSLAGALGQIDTVRRLGEMAEALMHAEATLHISETEDYQRRFGDEVGSKLDAALRET